MNYEDTAVSRGRRLPGRSRRDGDGTVRLLPMESDEYHCLHTDYDRNVMVPESLRSRRA